VAPGQTIWRASGACRDAQPALEQDRPEVC